MDIHYSYHTDPGKKRSLNEDAVFADREYQLFMVADGMGGHNAGEIASEKALNLFQEFFRKGLKDKNADWLKKVDSGLDEISNIISSAVKIANSRIYELSSSKPRYKGMGTTLAGVCFHNKMAYIFNIGDSRVYSYKDNNLLQITEDHSWIQEQVKMKLLTDTQARNHQWKNIITRALGTTKDADIDIFPHNFASGEIFLICTDGLTSMVKDDEIKTIIEQNRLDLNGIVNNLIDQANQKGGEDNISIIAIEII